MTSPPGAAAWSLGALLVAIVLSVTSRLNVGLVAIALAWLVGTLAAGLTPDAVMAGFPVSLFLTLTGVTLLFAVADGNGTLEHAAHRIVGMARGDARWLPVILFAIAMTVSSVGPGAPATVALVVPMAMAIGTRAGLSPLVVSLMVANGANAGNLSPFSAVGVIANVKMRDAGLGGHELVVWFANFAAHAIVAVAAWWLFGRTHAQAATPAATTVTYGPLTGRQRATAAVIGAWIVGVVAFKIPIGLGAFAAATALLAFGVADEAAALRKVPWGVIMMVGGVSMLVALLEKTGGMDQFASLLARIASPATVNGMIALVTGAISTYSSTSGVVLPTFLPTVPSLVQRLGGGDPLAVALSINVGASIVDVSPLSTLGALCVATVTDADGARRLYTRLMAWGLSMILVGAVLCQLLAGPLARIG